MSSAVLVVAVALVIFGSLLVSRAPQSSALGVTTPHLAVIVMENKEYGQVIGSPDAPYINSVVAPGGRVFSASYGVAHPSLPNYLALTAGDMRGCLTDGCPRNSITGENLFHQLNTAGITWKAYVENMPSPCATADSGAYLVRHNPPAYFTSLGAGGDGSCAAKDVPWSQLATDLGTDALPRLMWLVPNKYHGMHNDQNTPQCQRGSPQANQVCQGDAWLQANLPTILSNGGRNDVTVLVTFDEGTTQVGGGGHVPTIEIGPQTCAGCTTTAPFNHYGMVNAIEDWFGVPGLGPAVPDLTGTPPDTTPPSAPGQPTGSSAAAGSIDLSWAAATDPDNASLTYRVYRDGGNTPVGSFSSAEPVVSFTDTGLAPGSSHTYTVTASDGVHTGPPSPSSSPIIVQSLPFADGFESGTLAAWTTVVGLDPSADAHTGAWAAGGSSTGTSASYAERALSSTYGALYSRAWVKVDSQGTTKAINLLFMKTSSGGGLVTVIRTPAGYIRLLNDTTGAVLSNSTVVSPGVWHEVELHLVVAGSSSQVEVWLDGVRQSNLSTTISVGTTPIGRLGIGDSIATGRTYAFKFDDVAASEAPLP